MKVMVKDANYERVVTVMRKQQSDICSCPQCFNAVVATALNCMAPHYYTDPKWHDRAGSPWEIIESAVREALIEKPGHRGACFGGTAHGKTGK